MVSLKIAAAIQGQSQFIEQSCADRTGEADRNQYQIGIQIELASLNPIERRFWTDAHAMELLYIPVLVTAEMRSKNAPFTNSALLVRRFGS